jgi:hypothetical protein
MIMVNTNFARNKKINVHNLQAKCSLGIINQLMHTVIAVLQRFNDKLQSRIFVSYVVLSPEK